MNIKPILPFRAVVAGSAYPKDFTVEDEFAPDSDAAKAALDLGCLSDEDATVVREALGLTESQPSATEGKPAATKTKGANPPENKSGGAKT